MFAILEACIGDANVEVVIDRRPIDEAEALIIALVDAAIVQELDDGLEKRELPEVRSKKTGCGGDEGVKESFERSSKSGELPKDKLCWSWRGGPCREKQRYKFITWDAISLSAD